MGNTPENIAISPGWIVPQNRNKFVRFQRLELGKRNGGEDKFSPTRILKGSVIIYNVSDQKEQTN